jgi:hypothetical protein
VGCRSVVLVELAPGMGVCTQEVCGRIAQLTEHLRKFFRQELQGNKAAQASVLSLVSPRPIPLSASFKGIDGVRGFYQMIASARPARRSRL